MVHPDQKRWDEKFKRRREEGRDPSHPSWADRALKRWDGGPVLDLAGGRGGCVESVREDVYYLLVDISPVALRDARRRWERPPGTAGCVRADLESHYPFASQRALHGVFFFYSPPLFREIARRARPGSQVLAETYCGRGDSAPINEQYCLAPGELGEYFEGWDHRLYRERGEDHPETARLWAEKPEA